MLLIVLLKASKLVKLTEVDNKMEVGTLFHALMTLLAKKFIPTVQSLRGLYSLMSMILIQSVSKFTNYQLINVYNTDV